MKSRIRFAAATLATMILLNLAGGVQAAELGAGHLVPTGDQAIADASTQARAKLDDFLAKLANPPPGTGSYAVKLGIVDQGSGYAITRDVSLDNVEYFWLVNITGKDGNFTAQIGNDPETVKNVAAGQAVKFARADIFDWMYVDNGKLVGNYTACPILLAGPVSELQAFEQQTGMKCE